MSDNTTLTVQIPHEYEPWLGTESRDRILALRSVGLSVTNIARRFDVSREMIYRVMRNEKAPAPDTSTGPTTNPGGSALSVTDDGSKFTDSPTTKDTGGK